MASRKSKSLTLLIKIFCLTAKLQDQRRMQHLWSILVRMICHLSLSFSVQDTI